MVTVDYAPEEGRSLPDDSEPRANALSASYFNQVLGQIIERVQQLVGAEMGGLMLYDPQTNELSLQQPAIGFSEEAFRLLHYPLDHSTITTAVFRTGKSHLSNDLTSDRLTYQPWVRLLGVRNMITVPVDVDGKRIGVFHVVNKRSGNFTPNDLRLMSLLSCHLGILIQNTQLLERERLTVAKLQEFNQVIDQQREGLERTLAIHDELTRMVLDGQGLGAICATLARLIANPVAVVDRFGNLIAVNAAGFDEIRFRGWYHALTDIDSLTVVRQDPEVVATVARMKEGRRPVRLPPFLHCGVDHTGVVSPVVVGREILAYVMILEGNRSLDEVDVMAVERAATAIALELMKEKATAEAQYKLRGDFVAELVAGRGSEEVLVRQAAYLGIDLHMRRTVLVIRVDGSHSSTSVRRRDPMAVARVRDVVEHASRQAAATPVVATKGDHVVLLAATLQGIDHGRELEASADEIRAEVRRHVSGVTVSVGIGSPCENALEYALSYEKACRALDVASASRQTDRTFNFAALGISAVLFDPRIRDALLAHVDETLKALCEYDHRHTSELLHTLDQYLLNDCHLEPTAKAMCLHIGTLRYRLRRIEEITGVDLRNVEARFNLQLAVKVHRAINSLGALDRNQANHS